MTKDEAFKLAMQACKKTWNEKTCKQIKEVLEQQPCDDAVSRKDAEQMFRNIRNHLKPQDYKSAEEFNTRDLMLLNAEQMIHALPPVTPQQKMGRWIRVTDKTGHLVWECNKCGWQQRLNTNFCPDCGSYNGGNDNGNE